MKRIYLSLIVALMTLIISACGVEEFYFECDGFYITPYSEDVSGILGGFPYPLPYTVSMRVVDGDGDTLINTSLFTINMAGIMTSNGGFHEFSKPAREQPISIYLNVPFEFENELVDMLQVACEGSTVYFTDGRIGPDIATSLNAFSQDGGIAVYSEIDGSLFVSLEDIFALGNPQANTLLASYNGLEFYLLSDGLIQLMETVAEDGKRDILIFEVNEEGTVIRWRRGTFHIATGETNIYLEWGPWDGYPRNY